MRFRWRLLHSNSWDIHLFAFQAFLWLLWMSKIKSKWVGEIKIRNSNPCAVIWYDQELGGRIQFSAALLCPCRLPSVPAWPSSAAIPVYCVTDSCSFPSLLAPCHHSFTSHTIPGARGGTCGNCGPASAGVFGWKAQYGTQIGHTDNKASRKFPTT